MGGRGEVADAARLLAAPAGGQDRTAAALKHARAGTQHTPARSTPLLPYLIQVADRIKKHMGARVRILPPGVEKNVKDFAQNVESLVDKVVSGKRERLWFTACEPVSLCVCVEA